MRKPSSRVVRSAVGLVLVAAAAGIMLAGGRESGQEYLVFESDLTVGDVVTTEDLGVVRILTSGDLVANLVPAGELGSLAGSRVMEPQTRGEPVLRSSLGPVPAASGYTVVVPRTSFSGDLTPGDLVDVLASGEGHPAEIVAVGAVVSHVEVTTDPGDGEPSLLVAVDAPRDVLLDIEDASSKAGLRLLRSTAGGPA